MLHRRRAVRPGRRQPDPRHQQPADRRHRRRHRLRRDHGRAARPGQPEGHRRGRSAVRCAPRGRHPDAVGHRYADRPGAGHPVADRAVHRGPDAGPRDVPAQGPVQPWSAASSRRGGTDDDHGCSRPDDLTVEHVVAKVPVSRAQRLGAGLSLVALGLVTIWRFGLNGHHDFDAKIQLGATGAAHVPHFTVPAVPVAWIARCRDHRAGRALAGRPRAAAGSGPSWAPGSGCSWSRLICWLALGQTRSRSSTSSVC